MLYEVVHIVTIGLERANRQNDLNILKIQEHSKSSHYFPHACTSVREPDATSHLSKPEYVTTEQDPSRKQKNHTFVINYFLLA